MVTNQYLPFVSILENDFIEMIGQTEYADLGVTLIKQFLKFGFRYIHLTDNQRVFLRQANCNQYDPVIIESILRSRTNFPKCPEGLFEYKNLIIHGKNFDHLIFAGYFSQPVISLFDTYEGSLNCTYQFLEIESEKVELKEGSFCVRVYNSTMLVDANREEIENLAKAFIFDFGSHSFSLDPLPVVGYFKLLNEEANAIKGTDPDYSITHAKTLGLRIGFINSWEYNSALTKKNQRVVMTSKYTSKFLSIDTQHPQFEVHDLKGNHIGSVPYYGGIPSNAKNYRLTTD